MVCLIALDLSETEISAHLFSFAAVLQEGRNTGRMSGGESTHWRLYINEPFRSITQ